MKLSEEDISRVLVNDLPEQDEYDFIIFAAQDVGKLINTDFAKSREANQKAWSGISDLMARCIARGKRLADVGRKEAKS
ncbi:unnamed protein product [marine sediment metagenome]|uniref:Uncharacterized protein n=1 Tax=marine sediment metagenome TaxID=412755 RepID=X1P3V4_9ZZZZ